MKKIQQEKCANSTQKKGLHYYIIIKGSGKKTGIPTWKCIYCKDQVKSN